jgi:hypothetical protein
LGWQPQQTHPAARLGELLLTAEVINVEQLDKALEQVRESITPLGAVLIQAVVISREVLDFALAIQADIRAGKITKQDGVSILNSRVKAHS